MLVIGITGTNGSGKGTVVEYLLKKGFVHFSVSDFLKGRIAEKNLMVNRDNMIIIANELRQKFGSDYVVSELYKRARINNKDCVIESIRTVGEVTFLKNQGGFILVAVDADPETRYRRIRLRKSEKDNVSYKKFLADELRERQNHEHHKQNLNKCIDMADYLIKNNSSLDDLHAQIDLIFHSMHFK